MSGESSLRLDQSRICRKRLAMCLSGVLAILVIGIIVHLTSGTPVTTVETLPTAMPTSGDNPRHFTRRNTESPTTEATPEDAWYDQVDNSDAKHEEMCAPKPQFVFLDDGRADNQHGVLVSRCPQACGVCKLKDHFCQSRETKNVTKAAKLKDHPDDNSIPKPKYVTVEEDTKCECALEKIPEDKLENSAYMAGRNDLIRKECYVPIVKVN